MIHVYIRIHMWIIGKRIVGNLMRVHIWIFKWNSYSYVHSLFWNICVIYIYIYCGMEVYRLISWTRVSQLMAYVMLAGLGAALQSAIFAKFSEPELQWMKVCDMYGKFCNQSGEGIASSVVAWLGMVIVSGISAFSLFRLYGGNKGTKTNAGW